MIRDPDEYSTDLMKCLDVVDQREKEHNQDPASFTPLPLTFRCLITAMVELMPRSQGYCWVACVAGWTRRCIQCSCCTSCVGRGSSGYTL